MAKRKYVKENSLVKAINTDSLELQKPLVNEYYDINVHNSNMDKIDLGYKQNKNDISNINYELSKTENTKYTTANGIKEFSCKDGYIDNVVIEGETLVNLWDVNNLTFTGQSSVIGGRYSCTTISTRQYSDFWTSFSMLKPNTEYTVIYNIIKNTLPQNSRAIALTYEHKTTPHAFNENLAVNGGVVGVFKSLLTTKSDFTDVKYGLRSFVDNSTMGDGYEVELEIVLLEGDYTDKPISYFEGLKSVGQGDKIEVLSCNEDTQVLKNFTKGLIQDSSGNYLPNVDVDKYLSCLDYVPVSNSCEYFIDFDINKVYFYDSSKNYISYITLNAERQTVAGNNTFKTPSNCSFIRFRYNLENNTRFPKFATLCKKQDKKQIQTTLRSLPNGVKDTIEKRGNKYVKVQKCGEVVLNGYETITIHTNSEVNVFNISYDLGINKAITILSDKYKMLSSSGKEEGILYDYSNKRFRISTNKFSTIEDFVADLKSNPVTVVYELATPIITELPNFNPQTYSDNTTLLINSGVIQAEADFEVTNSMGSEIEVLKCITSDLIDNVVDEEVYYPKLLNGWTDRYSSNPLKISKIGNIVIMEGNLYSGTVIAGTLVFTIPHRFRPKRNMFVTVCSRATKSLLGTFSIGLDGNIVVQDNGFGDASSSSGGIAFSYTYSLI